MAKCGFGCKLFVAGLFLSWRGGVGRLVVFWLRLCWQCRCWLARPVCRFQERRGWRRKVGFAPTRLRPPILPSGSQQTTRWSAIILNTNTSQQIKRIISTFLPRCKSAHNQFSNQHPLALNRKIKKSKSCPFFSSAG